VQEVDPKSAETQVALAMSALALAFARTLRELASEGDSLAILQRMAQVEHSRLRQTPDAEMAVAIFRFVIQALRNPNVIDQPEDYENNG
jgi:hypothetical protein